MHNVPPQATWTHLKRSTVATSVQPADKNRGNNSAGCTVYRAEANSGVKVKAGVNPREVAPARDERTVA